jgi:hypothetical protein
VIFKPLTSVELPMFGIVSGRSRSVERSIILGYWQLWFINWIWGILLLRQISFG